VANCTFRQTIKYIRDICTVVWFAFLLISIFGRPFVKRFALCYRTVVCPVYRVCDIGALWPNGLMDQDETWHAGRPQPRPHCVRWEPSSPKRKRGTGSQFSAHVYCGQTAEWIKMPLGTEVGLDPGTIVVDGDPAPQEKGHSSPHLSTRVLWPTAGWIKMPLGIEVGLGLSHVV